MAEQISIEEFNQIAARIKRLEAAYGITSARLTNEEGTEWFPGIEGYTRVPGTKQYTPNSKVVGN